MANDVLAGLKFQNQNPYLLRLLEEGTQTTPIASPWQGASRLAFALLSGLEMGDQERKNEAARSQRMDLPGLENVPTAQPSIGQAGGNEPASIRYNNPGAQYPGPSANTFGSTGTQTIGGGHKIATFASPEEGAAAQFDLLNRNYTGRTVADAVTKWSGGNNVPAYLASVEKAGIPRNTVITPEFLRSPQGIQFAQAMAQHEAGRPYPMTPQQWQAAQSRAFADPAGQPTDTRLQAQRNRVVIPPQDAAKIRALLGSPDPANQALGLKYYEQATKPRDETRPLTDPKERARYGIKSDDQRVWVVDAKGDPKVAGEAPFSVKIDQTTESALKTEGAKLAAKRYNEIIEDVPVAKQMISDIATLQTLGKSIGTGKEAEIKAALGPYAEALGLKIDKLGEIQAYEAIVNRMAPQLRVKGTGAQSDFELRNFLKSLPGLGNTPEGNEIASRVMTGMYENKIKAAELAADAADGTLPRKEFEKQLRELPDPMKEWRDWYKKNQEGGDSGWQVLPDGRRIREKR